MWNAPNQSIVLRQVLQSMSRRSRLPAYRPASCCFLSSSSKSNHVQGERLPENSRIKNRLKSANAEESTVGLNHRRHDNNSIKYKKNLFKSKENYLSQARHVMNGILSQISAFENANASLPASPRQLDQQEQQQQAAMEEYQMELFQEIRELFQLLVRNVEDGTLNPSGKHGKQISNFLELILVAYSRLHIQHDTAKQQLSVYAACMEILHTLEQWNLDCQNSHYECVIACASREERWNEAATLYWKLIDPEAGGKPVDLQVDNPLGLFAIARASQEQAETAGGIMSSSAVEQVFDAVLRMSMISPSDQSKYVLAAGTALGHAGEWEGAVRYIQSSSVAQQLGEPLVASVMQACLLCDRPEEALGIYNDHIGSEQNQIADEWQWGGKSDRVDPLCRDLAMQAMVRTRGMSDTALDFFHQTRQEGVTISMEALRGVVGACECDRRWMDAVSIMYEILENAKDADWIVPGSGMVITYRRDGIGESSTTVPSVSVAVRWLPEMGGVLASAMRACNASSKFGVSLLLSRLVDLALPSSGAQALEFDRTSERLTKSLNMRLEQSLLPLFLRVRETEELLPATMDALGGLRCNKNAANLFDLVQRCCGSGQIPITSRQRYDRALDQVVKHADKVIGNAFESANRHIHRITAAVQTIQGSGVAVRPEGRKKIEVTLAAAMHACTDAHQPETSLYLALWTEKALNPPSVGAMKSSVETRFGTDMSSRQFLGFRTDAVLAEAISAFRFNRRDTEATELLQALHSRHGGNVSQWRLSYTAGLSAMVANGRVDEALELFNKLGDSGRTVDSFTVMAQGMLREKKWPEVYELYRFAQSKGCMSEDLGILAMRSVLLSREEGKLLTLRGIVDDTASCAGMDSERFLASRYWHLKRALGFNWARLLMWWNDRDTCRLDELALALDEFEQRRLAGLKTRHEAIRVIVGNAISFQEGSVPDHRKDLVTLPRTKPAWIELLLHVLEETRDSPLLQDCDFVDDANQALSNLNCSIEYVQYVNESLLKGER